MGKATESEQGIQLIKTNLTFRCITPESTVDLESDWDDESAIPHLMNPNASLDQEELDIVHDGVPNSPMYRTSCLTSGRSDKSPPSRIDKSIDAFGNLENSMTSLSLSIPSSPTRSTSIRHRRSSSQPGTKCVRYGSTLSTLKEGYVSSDWDIPEMTIEYNPPQYLGFQHSQIHRRTLSLPEQILNKIGSELHIVSPTRSSLQPYHNVTFGSTRAELSISSLDSSDHDLTRLEKAKNFRSSSRRSRSGNSKSQASNASSATQSNESSSSICLEDKVAFAWKNQYPSSDSYNTQSRKDFEQHRYKHGDSPIKSKTLKQSKKESSYPQNRTEQTDKSCVVQ